MKAPLRVLVADDHPIFRKGLCALIGSEDRFELVGEAENGQMAIDLFEKELPDVVILDVDMPVMDGVATARVLQKRFPEVKTIFLTMHKDREILSRLGTLGIKGYVIKDSAAIELIEAVILVGAGKSFISPTITELLLEKVSNESNRDQNLVLINRLTPSERRILRLIADSLTTRQIAEVLFVSPRTVENHRFNICQKLAIKGNHSLIKFAIANEQTIRQLCPPD